MNKTCDRLFDLLKMHSRLSSDSGELLKNLTQELARKNDPELVKLLLENEDIKNHFFTVVDNVLIFNQEKFIRFVSNKQFLADSYTSFKNKVGLTVDGNFLSECNEVVLTWPYKDCILEGGMTKEDQKRNEVFYNEILAPDEINRLLDPKVFTNFKRIDQNGEHEFDSFRRDAKGRIKDNLIIKGNNLLVLTSLMKEFAGRIKLIYIDPPYNTGGSGGAFFYNNTFKHSTWYVFMKNRLEQAKKLLTEDGFIAIAIDHFELFYLGVLADEIFERENRIGIVSVVHKPEGRNQEKFFATSNEFMLVYAKNRAVANFNHVILSDEKIAEYSEEDDKGPYKFMNYLRSGGGDHNLRVNKPNFYYPIYVSDDLSRVDLNPFSGSTAVFPITNGGQERTWKTKPDTFKKMLDKGYIVALKDGLGKITINEKYYANEKGQLIKTHWIDKRYNAINQGTKVVEDLLGAKGFSFPKSVYLVEDVIKIMADKDSIILDFFAGSGTTAHAVLDLNNEDGGDRNFILCEQMDYAKTITAKRVRKVIENIKQGDFVYMELAEWNEKWVSKIQKAEKREEIINLIKELKFSPFLSYRVNIEKFEDHLDEFLNLEINEQKQVLVEILDKNTLYVNFSEVEEAAFKISEQDKSINRQFYLGKI